MEQHRVHLGVPAHRGHDVSVEGEIKDIAQVDGVGGMDHSGPGAGRDVLDQRLGQGRQGEAKLAAGIGGDHRLAAAAGKDHQAVAPNRGLVHQFDGVQELGLGLDPDDAAVAAGGLQHPLIGGQGGGMRLGDGGRLRPHVGQMQVDGLGGLSSHLQEPPAILNPFQVDINGGSARVFQEVFQDLVFGHVKFIAQTQKLIEAQAFFGHPGQHMGSHPAALGNDGNPAPVDAGADLGKGQGQAGFQVDQAQAVGTDQAHAVLFQGRPHFRFQGSSRLV